MTRLYGDEMNVVTIDGVPHLVHPESGRVFRAKEVSEFVTGDRLLAIIDLAIFVVKDAAGDEHDHWLDFHESGGFYPDDPETDGFHSQHPADYVKLVEIDPEATHERDVSEYLAGYFQD